MRAGQHSDPSEHDLPQLSGLVDATESYTLVDSYSHSNRAALQGDDFMNPDPQNEDDPEERMNIYRLSKTRMQSLISAGATTCTTCFA